MIILCMCYFVMALNYHFISISCIYLKQECLEVCKNVFKDVFSARTQGRKMNSIISQMQHIYLRVAKANIRDSLDYVSLNMNLAFCMCKENFM